MILSSLHIKAFRVSLKLNQYFFLLFPIFLSLSYQTDMDAPPNLVTREVTEDTASVSWDRVQADIDSYMLSYSSAESSSGEIPVGADSTSYRLTGLRPGALYTVFLWAVKGSRSSRKTSTQAETGKLFPLWLRGADSLLPLFWFHIPLKVFPRGIS